MMNRPSQFALAATLGASMLCANAGAVVVEVNVSGTVGFNVIQGSHAGIPAGSPVSMSFQVDSTSFLNSPNFPTRGYSIDLSSFAMSVGGASVTIDDPQPFGPAYFVLRDNDPQVDGFLVSRNVDFPQPVGVHIPGLTPAHDLDFLVTYPNSTLSSLDIVDAVGSYDLTGLSVFGWTIGRFGNAGAEYNYETMTISIIPAPASVGLLGMAGLLAMRRRR